MQSLSSLTCSELLPFCFFPFSDLYMIKLWEPDFPLLIGHLLHWTDWCYKFRDLGIKDMQPHLKWGHISVVTSLLGQVSTFSPLSWLLKLLVFLFFSLPTFCKSPNFLYYWFLKVSFKIMPLNPQLVWKFHFQGIEIVEEFHSVRDWYFLLSVGSTVPF